MVPTTKESGEMAYYKVRAYSTIPMETGIVVASTKTELTATEHTSMKMVKFTRGTGKTICITEKVVKNYLTGLHTKECSKTEKGKDMEFTQAQKIIRYIKVNGTTIS